LVVAVIKMAYSKTMSWFDDKAVTSRVDKTTRKVLSRIGAYIMTAARQSIRTRKKASPPGSPPSSHVGLLKRGIFFGYDFVSTSVVIGPEPLHGKPIVPQVLEFGGVERLKDRQGKTYVATYEPRPFMGPAYEREIPKLPAMWRDSVKR